MSDALNLHPDDDTAPGPTPEQQRTLDGVEHAIDEARQAQADLRAVDAGAIDEPVDSAGAQDPEPTPQDPEDERELEA